jgi:hypothetical protein
LVVIGEWKVELFEWLLMDAGAYYYTPFALKMKYG